MREKTLIAEIAAERRRDGVRWLMLVGHIEKGSEGSGEEFVDLEVFGPMAFGEHELRGSSSRRFNSITEAMEVAPADWDVTPGDWKLPPEKVDLNGELWPVDWVVSTAVCAREAPWIPLEEPNPDGHCMICTHSYVGKEQIPTTHRLPGPPLTHPNEEYLSLCSACYARFIDRDGLTELMERLLGYQGGGEEPERREQPRDLKKQYHRSFMWMRSLMNHWDPMELIALEYPDDEYDDEVARILVLVGRSRTFDDFVAGIQDVLKEAFGIDVTAEYVQPFALRAWRRIREGRFGPLEGDAVVGDKPPWQYSSLTHYFNDTGEPVGGTAEQLWPGGASRGEWKARKFRCPNCGAEVLSRMVNRGVQSRCLKCGTVATVPDDAVVVENIMADRATCIAEQEAPSRITASGQRFGAQPGIGGWLIMSAIGLVVNVLFWFATGMYGVSQLLQNLVSDSAKPQAAWMTQGVVAAVVMAGLWLWCAVLFFGKKRQAPTAIRWILAGQVAYNVVAEMTRIGFGGGEASVFIGVVIGGKIAFAAIWIAYFKVSERVKVTFAR